MLIARPRLGGLGVRRRMAWLRTWAEGSGGTAPRGAGAPGAGDTFAYQSELSDVSRAYCGYDDAYFAQRHGGAERAPAASRAKGAA